MSKKIFRSILAVSAAVLLICVLCVSYVLHGYFGKIIEDELKEEGKKRVERHKKLREGKDFYTIEQTMHISGALEKIKNPRNSTVLIECMSNLVANEMFEPGGNTQSIIKECMTIRDKCSNIIIVTNDIFSDGCIYDESTREYIRQLAYINRQLAQDADIVEEVVYSVPVRLKTIYEII